MAKLNSVEDSGHPDATSGPTNLQIIDNGVTTAATSNEPAQRTFDYPTEVVYLPSRGLIYNETSPLSKGYVEIKYMTAKEEDILTTRSYIQSGVVLDKLAEAVIVTPDVKFDDLLLGDKNAILIATRAHGYGPHYELSIKSNSGTDIPVYINLHELKHKQFNENLITKGINSFEFVLPTQKLKLEFKLLTVGDQKLIEKSIKSSTKIGMSGSSTSKSLTTRFRYMITSVNGDSDPAVIAKVAENMLAIDARAFREYISEIQPDIDLNMEVVDPDTGETFHRDVEFGVNLFYPDFKG